jgi:hypothetical protein
VKLKKIIGLNLGEKTFEPMPGRAMKSYVVVPQAFYCNDELFREWLELSFGYSSSLPPKRSKAPERRERKPI